MKIRVIITGATGMAGEGVLHECLQYEGVDQILVINRKPCGVKDPKLKEIIHADFFDLSPIANLLTGYNACFFCLGVSAVGLNEKEYYRLTYSLSLYVAELLVKQNRDMVFCYISGSGTDSTGKGRMMCARVKGRTENDLMILPFKNVYTFRPGYMQPTKGLKNTLRYYKYLQWLYPLLRTLLPKYVSTLKELGQAMIQATLKGYQKNILEVKDIVALARQE